MENITQMSLDELKQLIDEAVDRRVRQLLNELQSIEFEEDSDEEILAGFRQGWHEAMTGQARPAREVLARLREARKNEPKS